MTASKIQMDQIRSTSATCAGEKIRAGSQKKSSLSQASGLHGASPDATCTCPCGDGSLVHPCPAHPASVEQAGGDERAAFEAWATHLPMDRQYLRPDLYMPPTQWAWDAWQARAALAQPSPAQAEKAEVERPEVVGSLYLGGWADQEELEDNDVELDMKVVERLQVDLASKGDGVHMPLMTVAQHERITAQLHDALDESDGDRWKLRSERDAANARLHEVATACATAEQERDAALARVAELEKQEPVATIAKVPGEDWNGLHFYRDPQDMQPGTKLYAAPVAQAQHSVPELDQSRSALTEAQMRRIYENSTEIENERLGFAAFARLMRRAEAVHQIAAAPGKEVGHE
ncbi:TPA: hypothetical protein L3878_001195 [Pseudomonas aeruginosa]|nr:hypothetical protein [Pseudomonas aeruginosa]